MIVHTGLPRQRVVRNKWVSGHEARKFATPATAPSPVHPRAQSTAQQYPSNTAYLTGEPVTCARTADIISAHKRAQAQLENEVEGESHE